MNKRFWFVLPNDVDKPVGGVKQIHRLCESINSLNHECYIIQEDKYFAPSWFDSNVKSVSLKAFLKRTDLNPSHDYLIIPETMIPYVTRFLPGFKKIIFNQNISYTFGVNPKTDGFPKNPQDVLDLYSHKDVIAIWCVSRYDLRTLLSGFSLAENMCSLIVNSIESDLFYPSFPKKLQICYMSRKNPTHSMRVRAMINAQSFKLDWGFKEIIDMTLPEVASVLRSSAVFFSFGHPEGFGLPVAESIASGCFVVGYSGLGGEELFDLGKRNNTAFSVPFGDLEGFIARIRNIDLLLDSSPASSVKNSLLASSRQLTAKYSPQAMANSLRIAIEKLTI